jgi:gliding motility-associated-like protein
MTSPGVSFRWDFGDGESDTLQVSPDHTYGQWGDYDVTLSIETGNGCVDEITHTVVIEQDLVFPNVMTPNGDGINDVFAIENLNTSLHAEDPDGYRNNKLVIFDRWGKKVYEADNYDTFSRDGQIQLGSQVFDASGVSDGVYYFSFYYKGKAKTTTYNGSLTIIR